MYIASNLVSISLFLYREELFDFKMCDGFCSLDFMLVHQ